MRGSQVREARISAEALHRLIRGKRTISVSLKSGSGVALLKTLLSPPSTCQASSCKCSPRGSRCTCGAPGVWRADVLIDPFRPGVLERLGLGPDVLLQLNPRLIIARLTGFRRDGPYSKMAGHDLNYIALSGVLSEPGSRRCFGATTCLPSVALQICSVAKARSRTSRRTFLVRLQVIGSAVRS